jgi:hypothetical protein
MIDIKRSPRNFLGLLFMGQPLLGWDVEGMIYTGLFDGSHLKDLPIIQFNPLRGLDFRP